MRLILSVIVATLALACGSESNPAPAPTSSSNPAPAPTGFSLSGRVTVAPPTADTGIAGAILTIVDSANAGRSATTDVSGNYTFTNLQAAGFSMSIAAPGYAQGSQGVTLTSNQTANVALAPAPAIVTETLTGTISGGDPSCASFPPTPCKVHTIPIHNTGTFSAAMTWNTGADLDLELRRGTTLIAESDGIGGSEQVSANLTGGANYELRVIYYSGSLITGYSIAVSRMN